MTPHEPYDPAVETPEPGEPIGTLQNVAPPPGCPPCVPPWDLDEMPLPNRAYQRQVRPYGKR